MNNRKAKKLRRLAETRTIDKADREYQRSFDGNIVLTEGCTRQVYAQLKKAA